MVDLRAIKLSNNFRLSEFCPDDDPLRLKRPEEYINLVMHLLPNAKRVATQLEKIRAHFKANSVVITPHGGLRSYLLNEQAGGATKSRHLTMEAADIKVFVKGKQIPPRLVAEFAKTLPEIGGIGVYQTFTHVDVRPRVGTLPTTWIG